MSEATVPPIAPGTLLAGKFRVERVLGEGGMGIVVAAHHVQLDERVALKFLRANALANVDATTRFIREARAATKIKNEHVAKVLDVGVLDDGAPFMVMEFLDGCDLAAEVRDRGPLQSSVAAAYLLQALEAIAEAHALGIVHRDLKPSNLFLTRGSDGLPLVKVLDFGISKVLAGSSASPLEALTQTESLIGSPLYMSPEQLTSAKTVDQRADIWAIGVILHELVMGTAPFRGETLPQICSAILQMEPTRMGTPGVAPGLEAVVARCLAKDPAARFGDVAGLAHSLAPFDTVLGRLRAERIARILGKAIAVGEPAVSAFASTVGAPDHAPSKSTLEPGATTLGEPVARSGRASAVAVGIGLAIVVAAGLFASVRARSDAHALAGSAVSAESRAFASVAPPIALSAAPAAAAESPAAASASAMAASSAAPVKTRSPNGELTAAPRPPPRASAGAPAVAPSRDLFGTQK